MVQRQKESLAKYLYDLSKILFGTTVLRNLVAAGPFDMITFFWGGILTVMSLYYGYALDGIKKE